MSSNGTFDVAVVGSSFAASFFLHGWLKHAPANARAVVLERGGNKVHGQLVNLRLALRRKGLSTFRRSDDKPWWYSPVVGGTSNMWFGNTPRMRPDDFELMTRYGQGVDWPLSYDTLEPYYAAAEELMHVAGPANSPVPRSTPFPQAAHALSDPELLLAKAWPEHFSACPTARASRPVPGGRGPCCTSFKCNTCPVDAKFTVLNGLSAVYDDPRVSLRPRSTVVSVDVEGGRAVGVMYRGRKGKVKRVRADVVALGANALFNPHILTRSGLGGGAVGRYLNEQVGVSGHVDLIGVDGYQGGTSCNRAPPRELER